MSYKVSVDNNLESSSLSDFRRWPFIVPPRCSGVSLLGHKTLTGRFLIRCSDVSLDDNLSILTKISKIQYVRVFVSQLLQKISHLILI